ncbi:MAG: DUF4901 domain-containing protein [Candidatus Desulforudis sp.]|nr:DUF4901 domain-containing protein [Desulforudis sp.]
MAKRLSRYSVLIPALLFACLMFVLPASALERDVQAKAVLLPASGAQSDAQAKVSLEQAIRIAKGVFTIPAEYMQFSSDYMASAEEAVWNLRWFAEGSPGGSFHVTVSAVNGEVINVSYHKGYVPGKKYSGFPKYSREDAQVIAEKAAAKLQAERYAQSRLMPEPVYDRPYLPSPGTRDYPVTYQFRFQRLSAGIPVTENVIHVEVNGETGEVQHFNVWWDVKAKLPSAAGHIDQNRARQIFNQDGLELAYVFSGARDRDDGSRPYLAYRLRDGGFLLDAITGILIDPDGEFYFAGDLGSGGMGGSEAQKLISSRLSPEESATVEETKGLLTAEAARRAAEAAYTPPSGVSLNRSHLSPNWNAPGNKVWELGYGSEEQQTSVSMTVDARTGEFLHFSAYEGSKIDYFQTPAVKFSEAQARTIAEALMRQLHPEKAKQVTFKNTRRELGPWAEQGEPLPRAYSFSYARLINGIPYPDNGFYIVVDSTTGEVSSYALKWWDTEFPAAEGIIGKDRANTAFLAKTPLKLEYSKVYSRWGRTQKENEYRLVYRPDGRTDLLVDARTGKVTDQQGNAVPDQGPKTFTDIAGHPAEQDILLLANAGNVGGNEGRFRPNERITNAELLTMLAVAHSDSHRHPMFEVKEGAPWYESFLDRAVAMGIIESKDQVKPNASTTRLEATRFLVNAKGFGPLAKKAALFRLEVADAGSVPATDRGYVASAVGLGMLTLDKGKFRPGDTLTRGEAAQILVRSLKG